MSKHQVSQKLLEQGYDLSTVKCSHNTSLSVSLNQLINSKKVDSLFILLRSLTFPRKMKKSPVIKLGDGYTLHSDVTDEFLEQVKSMRNLNWVGILLIILQFILHYLDKVDPFLRHDYVHQLPELLPPVRGNAVKAGLFCSHCGMKYLGAKAFNEHRRNYKKQKGKEHPPKEDCVKEIYIQNLKPKGKVSSQQRIRVGKWIVFGCLLNSLFPPKLIQQLNTLKWSEKMKSLKLMI